MSLASSSTYVPIPVGFRPSRASIRACICVPTLTARSCGPEPALGSCCDAATACPLTHIAMVAPNGRRVGGAETHLLDLAAALLADGLRVTLLHRTPGHDDVDGAEFLHVPSGVDAGHALVELAPDLVHVHGDGLLPDEAEAQRRRTPVVRSLHDWSLGCSTGTLLRRGTGACPRAHGPKCLLHIAAGSCSERRNPLPAVARWREVGPARGELVHAGSVVVYSEYAREVAIRNGVAPARCHVLPYFVDTMHDTGPPPGSGRVCVVGRLTKIKGVHVLLEAVARTPRVTQLEIVGDGYHRADLIRLAHRLGVASRVTFCGWKDAAGTRAAMGAADLVAVPSLWPEPFGIVGLEAMACARAVIASGTGAIPEWLADGETGRIVRSHAPAHWADALDEALADPDRLTRWGAAGAQHVQQFSRERHVRRLRELYAALLAG